MALTPFDDKKLLTSGYSSSIPVISGSGGQQQGQNRDKSPIPASALRILLPLVFGLAILGTVVTGSTSGPGGEAAEDPDGNSDILPRPKRKRKKASEDRGLPPDEQIRDLARVYLTTQRKHWPKLIEKGVLLEPTAEVIEEMVSDYKHRHRGGIVDTAAISLRKEFLTALKAAIGGGYGRFSCDNSNPTSIIDQLTRWLSCAANKGFFVPWSYVFSDYSVSGLDSARRGYQSYKELLGDSKHHIQVTFIDDFTRASRDELEWWKLAFLSRRLRKGLFGASDGFDLSSEAAEVMMSVYSMLSKLFIRGLRQNVMRRMKGASSRGGVLGKLELGFTRQKVLRAVENGGGGRESGRLKMAAHIGASLGSGKMGAIAPILPNFAGRPRSAIRHGVLERGSSAGADERVEPARRL